MPDRHRVLVEEAYGSGHDAPREEFLDLHAGEDELHESPLAWVRILSTYVPGKPIFNKEVK